MNATTAGKPAKVKSETCCGYPMLYVETMEKESGEAARDHYVCVLCNRQKFRRADEVTPSSPS